MSDNEPLDDDELDDDEVDEERPPMRGSVDRYDWSHVEMLFAEGDGQRGDGSTHWPTLTELAARFNIPYDSVRRRSSTKGWVAKRQQYRDNLERERFRRKAEKQASESDHLDEVALDVGKIGLALVKARLQDMAIQYRDRAKDGVATGLSTSELERLAKSADVFQRIGLRSLGGDPDVSKFMLTDSVGQPIEIAGELGRDDPDRMASVLNVLVIAGLGHLFGTDEGGDREARAATAIEARSTAHPSVPDR